MGYCISSNTRYSWWWWQLITNIPKIIVLILLEFSVSLQGRNIDPKYQWIRSTPPCKTQFSNRRKIEWCHCVSMNCSIAIFGVPMHALRLCVDEAECYLQELTKFHDLHWPVVVCYPRFHRVSLNIIIRDNKIEFDRKWGNFRKKNLVPKFF